jgi:hypothetical protein
MAVLKTFELQYQPLVRLFQHGQNWMLWTVAGIFERSLM